MLHVQFTGSHYEIGLQLGRTLACRGQHILDQVPFPLTGERLAFVRACLPLYRNWFPGALEELRGLKKRSLRIIAVFAVLMFAAAFVLAEPLSRIFIGYDEALLSLTLRAFSIFSFSFLFSGFSIFGSAFFTALNNGPVSAAISFLRTLVFQIASVLVLPLFFQIDGIWASIVFAEIMSVIMTALFLKLLRKKYGY